MSALIEREGNNEIFLPEVRQNPFNPDSESNIRFAVMIIRHVSNNKPLLCDPSIKADDGNLGFYDWSKKEYRATDGKFIYVVSQSLILGKSTQVEKRRLQVSGINKFIFASIYIATSAANTVTLKNPKIKFEWASDKENLNLQLLEELKKQAQ